MNARRTTPRVIAKFTSNMKSKQFFVLALVVLIVTAVGVMALSGCSMFGGGEDANARPSPTLPFPTNVVVDATPASVETAAPQEAMLIGGDVFNDSNGNATKDPGEPIIAGVIVQIAQGECPGTLAAQTTTTVSTPSYKFEGLSGGAFCVSVDATTAQNAGILGQGQWMFPQQAQGVIADTVKLNNRSKPTVNFGWTFATIGQVTAVPEGTPEATAAAAEPTPVQLLPTPTAFVEPTAGPAPCVYKANYVADVTIPDNTVMAPGSQFTKTWRVLNSGTCPWGPGTGLQNMQFISGDPLGAPNMVPIAANIAAGTQGEISINMVAPAQPGTYRSNWKLRADDGTLVGVGASNVSLYALIRVQAAPPPTSVPPPTTVPPPGPPTGVIQMEPGATEAEVQGQLVANQIATYSVSAQANQNMQLSLSSNSNSARVAVLSPGGFPLPPQRGNPEGTYWQGNLPTTGTYIVQVLAGNATPTANYSLNVTIPVRIQFAPGAISASVQGTTSQGRIVTYLLKANGGQTMKANLTAPPNSAGITIYGLDDGQPLIRSQSGATSFEGQLPATQDYVIQVVPFGNARVDYTLDVTVQ